jgi:hypothetical protein
MRHLALLSVLVAFLVAGCGGSHQSKPPWVNTGVKALRAYFVGSPRPSRVAWGRTARTDWVTVAFSAIQTCKLCHGPTRSVVAGRRATITWHRGRHSVTGISIQKN